MLKKIPHNLSPELVKALMEMGHGDEILLADANYPALTNNSRVIRADGLSMSTLLPDILELLPLDTYSDYQAILMEVVPGDDAVPNGRPQIWNTYEEELKKVFPNYQIKTIERQHFYTYTHKCFTIVQTGETALYGNLILKKGVV
ncbi:RbsD/FucU family protein [Lactiplantibacillus plantarum]|uniref:RbsD/FucU family protein n=1 Tax=Lactobacillaceae TaxID=33958 RepID=UPI0007B5622A|nr:MULTISPECIES: RbsD/FucU domain-containing protein [Lactobacillaceae]KZU23766.1 L-fucose mutarotase [Lactiplantibacillus plantarum]KZU23845.1 L-fucose mutarotase [Lactiplantibacillus plantarum]MCB7151529.1 fucose isomerase [Lactiplantibacillus plantarum]MCB7172216.1 fucose isomerase [Lactiplantibacillus plantarum]WIE00697.1 RbsD/FucU domain-containing protein [Latilactobacillus curvatus]